MNRRITKRRISKRYRNALNRLYTILEPYSPWHDTVSEQDNHNAYLAILEFRTALMDTKPIRCNGRYCTKKKRNVCRNVFRYDSLRYLRIIPVYKAFLDRRYDYVCHELTDMVYFQTILMSATYTAVLELLNLFLEDAPCLKEQESN